MYHVINGLHLCAAVQLESTTRLRKIYLPAPEIGFWENFLEEIVFILTPPRDVQVKFSPPCVHGMVCFGGVTLL